MGFITGITVLMIGICFMVRGGGFEARRNDRAAGDKYADTISGTWLLILGFQDIVYGTWFGVNLAQWGIVL